MAIQNIQQTLPSVIAHQGLSGNREIGRPGAPPPVEAPARISGTSESEAISQRTALGAAEKAEPPTRAQIDKAMVEVKKALDPVARNLQFSIDEDTGRTVIKVVDSATKEVIRQMPSEELLELTRSLDSLSGLLIKQKV